ncbi:hypothetical protein CVT25_007761 [Psilocybe cyanescens]|uniref:Uncharacterized protein n=1 Tax=Psilocybe cyanescens TaxID=93625 RepID=A0A409XHY0_PSICY|nr:hypothetical protein CVT25_007761 [Psilocybe cyanescens]
MATDTVQDISLGLMHDSKITKINLYSGSLIPIRFLLLQAKLNSRYTTCPCHNHDSIRVEAALTLFRSQTGGARENTSTARGTKLLNVMEQATNALQHSNKVLQAIDKYIGKISIERIDIDKLGEPMNIYDTTDKK